LKSRSPYCLRYSNGDIYVGQWKMNMRHGQVHCRSPLQQCSNSSSRAGQDELCEW
jgi:hypothetical protein